DRAMQFIEAETHESVSVLDLCSAIRVCPRTLVYSFRSQLGVSPNRFLLASRLNGVYRDIRSSSSPILIRQIAARWGFWHMGRFASYYRELFGESPSATVRAARALGKKTRAGERSNRCGTLGRMPLSNCSVHAVPQARASLAIKNRNHDGSGVAAKEPAAIFRKCVTSALHLPRCCIPAQLQNQLVYLR